VFILFLGGGFNYAGFSKSFTFISFPAASAACWHSHFTLLRRIANGDDDVVIVFEDDIDMEWDLEKRLRYLWKFLPDQEWDQVMIGSSRNL
jgi:GR25 family glycosyltransferase involved in LPS biosynthesis